MTRSESPCTLSPGYPETRGVRCFTAHRGTCPHAPALGRGQSGEDKGTLKGPGKEPSAARCPHEETR